MGRRKVMTTPQEHWLKQHIPSWLEHHAKQSLDHLFYPPVYEEFFAKWPVPPATAEELAEQGGDLAAAKSAKYKVYRTVSNVSEKIAVNVDSLLPNRRSTIGFSTTPALR